MHNRFISTGCSSNNIQVGLKSSSSQSGYTRYTYDFLIQTNALNPGTILALIDFGQTVSTETIMFTGAVS
jgi:hypothetical protein